MQHVVHAHTQRTDMWTKQLSEEVLGNPKWWVWGVMATWYKTRHISCKWFIPHILFRIFWRNLLQFSNQILPSAMQCIFIEHYYSWVLTSAATGYIVFKTDFCIWTMSSSQSLEYHEPYKRNKFLLSYEGGCQYQCQYQRGQDQHFLAR